LSRLWLDLFLGKIGQYVLKAFSDYYIYFIPVVLLYGIFMAISAYNLKRMEKRINYEIIHQAKFILRRNPGISFLSLVQNIAINWDEVIKLYSFFPYISNESELWVSRSIPSNLKKIIIQDENRIRLILERNNIIINEDNKDIRNNLYLENVKRVFRR
jgi:hypothetical protein